jgi:formylglycine-generating enzyme required for sulfatase activity
MSRSRQTIPVPARRRSREALIAALEKLARETDDIGSGLNDLNDPAADTKIEPALGVVAALLAVHLPEPNHAVVEGLALLSRVLKELWPLVQREDPQDRGYAGNFVVGAIGRLRMALDAASEAAARAYPGGKPIPIRRGAFDPIAVKTFMAELDAFQALVKVVASEKDTAPSFEQQGELVTFYVRNMTFRIDLARRQLMVNSTSLDLGALVANIAAIRDDSDRFLATVLDWFDQVTDRLLTGAMDLTVGVTRLVACVKMLGGMIGPGNDGPEMILIQPGRFMMGIPAAESKREGTESVDTWARPQHRVTISRPFLLGKYPVTRGEYAEFVRETNRPWQPPDFEQTDRHPAVNVRWGDAVEYADWLSRRTGQHYRLPSDAEWEYACRAGTKTARYWGEEFDPKHGNFDPERTTEVDAYQPNKWGLFDMLGNVAEWVADTWHQNYKGAPNDGSAWTTPGSEGRVLRGSWWRSGHGDDVRCGSRGRGGEVPSPRVGFRLARTL